MLQGAQRVMDKPRPAAAPVRPSPAPSARPVRVRWVVMTILCGGLLAITLLGMPYFVLDMGGRMRHELHPWFKASGLIGQSAGIGAMALFLFIWLYPLRKKFRFLAFTGNLVRWLDLHVLAGLLEDRIGLLLSLNALTIVVFEMVLIHAVRHRDRMRLSGVGAVLICAGFALVPFGSSLGYLAATVLVWTIGEMLTLPILNVVVAERASHRYRGQYMGLFATSYSIACGEAWSKGSGIGRAG